MRHILLTIIFFIFLASCQKNLIIDEVFFDNTQLNIFSFNAAEKEIKITYESSFDDPFIEHVMKVSPGKRALSWLENNINNFGTMNLILVDIQQASIVRKEIFTEKKIAGVIKKQGEYLYELNFIVFFNLLNDDRKILATSNVEVVRTTTSSKFISLNERDHILNRLTLDSLKDLSSQSLELLKIHMSEYML